MDYSGYARSLKHQFLRSLLEAYIRRWGWIYRQPQVLEYGNVLPLASYLPWNMDPEFLATYRAILDHTLVDLYRCWDLWLLVGQAAKCGGSILEVGVWRGGTGALIAKRAALSGINGTVYLCDTFRGVVKAGEYDTIYKGGEHHDTAPKIVENLFSSLGVTARILAGVFPDDTAHLIPSDDRFGFVHIDVDVYQSAKDVVNWVWDRLLIGGLVVYDDYGFKDCRGIARYVNEQIPGKDRIVIHNLNGHAVVLKIR